MEKIVRLLILFLLLCNMPGFLLVYVSPTVGSFTSFLTSGLLIAYFFLIKDKHKPIVPLIIFSTLYFVFSSFNYNEIDTNNYFIKESLRFMIVVICGIEVLYNTSKKDLFYILLIGAISVIINGTLFPLSNEVYGLVKGRFSGFYLNPNYAGSICLIGFALSFSIKNIKWKYFGQLSFTFAGILTLSRTFLLIWVVINLIAIYKSKKNVIAPIIGGVAMIIIFGFSSTMSLEKNRFKALESVFTNEEINKKVVGHDTRDESWSLYYNKIFDKPFFGNGFMNFQIPRAGLPGVHNTYLMIIGESGIIPFLIFIVIYLYILISCIALFKLKPELLYIIVVIMLSLMAGHGYFFNFFNVFLTMYIYIEIRKSRKQIDFNLN